MAKYMDFTGKTVFVAGGTSGINLGIAEGFARHGAKVAVLSRNPDKVNAAVEKLKGYGQEAVGFSADVRDAEAVANALADAASALGKFDVLISGAAGNFPAPALGLSSNGFKAVMDIDVLGSFHVLRFAHQHLNAPGASIINISAPQSYVPMEMQLHVCAAKAGVDQMTRVLAMEWGREGIRVNSIVPGPIEGTEGMERLAPSPEAMQRAAEAVPLERLGTTEDIANAAMFLSSPLATYISGIVMPVDGGWSLSGAGLNTRALAKALREKVAG
ncbi:MAG: SDR family oxidoreductase [Alphaproteobacteria bacterium]|nr:SDR family oxidoreductase [Alphaproteobacteria bacterium]